MSCSTGFPAKEPATSATRSSAIVCPFVPMRKCMFAHCITPWIVPFRYNTVIAARIIRRPEDFLFTAHLQIKMKQWLVKIRTHYICTLSRGIEQCIFLLHVRLTNVNDVAKIIFSICEEIWLYMVPSVRQLKGRHINRRTFLLGHTESD